MKHEFISRRPGNQDNQALHVTIPERGTARSSILTYIRRQPAVVRVRSRPIFCCYLQQTVN
eukprot:1946712-Heterocapsa_arctica.AAC.1